jgi:hypothetical protein
LRYLPLRLARGKCFSFELLVFVVVVVGNVHRLRNDWHARRAQRNGERVRGIVGLGDFL